MVTDEGSGASAPRNPDRIPAVALFDGPPGVEGALTVGAEDGDIVIYVELTGQPFCTFIVTLDSALTLSTQLCARIVDERRRQRP